MSPRTWCPTPIPHPRRRPRSRRRPRPPPPPAAPDTELLQAVQAATSLLKAYRTHGHLAARLDPLGSEGEGDPALVPENLNLTPELMSQIPASILRIGVEGETLLEALPRMREAYCGTIAYQIEHLASHQQRVWLREMIETGAHRKPLSAEEKQALLKRLIHVFQFERFLQRAYLGQKMFSIEGLDAVVPMIDELVTIASRGGAEEVVIGMAHRGRLDVLTHNLGRSAESIMAEFEGAQALERVKRGGGDPARRDRRRQVSPRGRGAVHDLRRRDDQDPPLSEPEPPRVRRSGRHRGRPGRSDLPLRADAPPQPGARRAAPAPRRRRVPGPGRGCGDAQPPVAGGLLDRRHDPPDHRQPGGLHDRPRGGPLDAVRLGHGEGLQRPDHPRERRRRGSVHLRHPPGDGVPRALEPRHGHRPDRLPPLRPQRDRRAGVHPAEDGGADQGAPAGLGDLRGAAGQGGRGHARGRRARERRGHRGVLSDSQGAQGQDGVRGLRVRDRHAGRHGGARPDQEPGRRHRRLRPATPSAERGAPAGPGELHDPPQAAQAARRGGSTRSATRAASTSGTRRRSRSPRCSRRAPTSA